LFVLEYLYSFFYFPDGAILIFWKRGHGIIKLEELLL
jgi:hypothetical protein